MKRGRSTGKPTKAEEARIVGSKEGPCMACEAFAGRNGQLRRCDGKGCDYNHCKSGNIRRGHMEGFALCAWHHRAVPSEWARPNEMRAYFGPSLMDGGKLFREAYGTDDELIERQTRYLEGEIS